MSFANWSFIPTTNMQNSLFNKSLTELQRDRNLMNLPIICSNDNISDSNQEECLQWLTQWDSRPTQVIQLSDTTTSSDITYSSMNTIESTVFSDLLFISNTTQTATNEPLMPVYKWPFLLLGLLVIIGGFGNILVCLAIGFERRLQNATNYFLLRYLYRCTSQRYSCIDCFLNHLPYNH